MGPTSPAAGAAGLPAACEPGTVEALVAAAQAGDGDAFGRIHDLYAERIYRYCRSRVAEPRDAEDLTQLTFLRVIEALPRYEPRGIPFGAWLFRVARNAAVDHARRRRDHLELDAATDAAAVGADPAGSAVVIERPALLRALAQLTPDQREVVALRYFADLSGPEIARATGKAETAVRALQVRGLASLRRALETDGAPSRAVLGAARPAEAPA